METPVIRAITDPADPALAQVEVLFAEMHVSMAAQGMRLQLADGGARIWLDGITPGLERFGHLLVAEADGELMGFAHGALKLAPEHLGGVRLGHVTHLHVRPAHRRKGIGAALAHAMHEWFDAVAVHSVELQVVAGNTEGIAFWRALGYGEEIVQMRREG